MSEAKARQREVEYKELSGTLIIPKCITLAELLDEYVNLYGKTKWALSTYEANTSLIRNYIVPQIGDTKLTNITTQFIERYYKLLLKTEAVPNGARQPRKASTSHLIRSRRSTSSYGVALIRPSSGKSWRKTRRPMR